VLTHAFLWRLLELDEADGRPIDLVIATKFPSYVVRHPRKVVWLVHQFRQAYELDRTDLGQFGESPLDRATRRAVQRLDQLTLGEAKGLFAISENVADRARRSTGLSVEALSPPPQKLDYRCESYGDFVLSVGRLDRAKRTELLVEAVAREPGLRAVIVGEGPERQRLEGLARERNLDGRVTFAGRLDNDALSMLYAQCLAVFYAPVDEDLGLVPREAFLFEKPVVTTTDAGGPLEVVIDSRTGVVCEPSAEAVARACSWLAAHPERAREWGRSGKELAARATWDNVIDRLLAA
jgi:glycosyltransferase involved in cell wall biosynthesis